jgi:hypothetical protein
MRTFLAGNDGAMPSKYDQETKAKAIRLQSLIDERTELLLQMKKTGHRVPRGPLVFADDHPLAGFITNGAKGTNLAPSRKGSRAGTCSTPDPGCA